MDADAPPEPVGIINRGGNKWQIVFYKKIISFLYGGGRRVASAQTGLPRRRQARQRMTRKLR
ncbi:hypothetical protein CEY11_13695 [Candidimonas nitroreducens]|uniref:Uncharacterized protein n=1 Tax=Candidimonas nitroreducens TaxID=683354 RepID=A0A225MD51_9BURK|nr:hypothetical protein CEY11_13695 [Candidimonas nitroreducens]